MGVKNSRYERVTVYLKKAQVDFLSDLLKEITDPNVNKPSRSDIIRGILDQYCNTEDWQTEGLLNVIGQRMNIKKQINAIHSK